MTKVLVDTDIGTDVVKRQWWPSARTLSVTESRPTPFRKHSRQAGWVAELDASLVYGEVGF